MSGRVSINIPFFNSLSMLRRCLDSVSFYTSYTDYEIVLVDDGSSEEGISEYAKSNADVYIRHDVNMGIAKSRYDALKASTGEYICAMDSDTVVSPHWLEKLVNVLDNGERQLPRLEIISALLSHRVGYQIRHPALDSENNLIRMIAVGTACMLFRRQLIEEIGSFDPRMANVYSDLEFCHRLRLYRGIPKAAIIAVEPRAIVYHHGWVDPATGHNGLLFKDSARSAAVFTKHECCLRDIEGLQVAELKYGIGEAFATRRKALESQLDIHPSFDEIIESLGGSDSSEQRVYHFARRFAEAPASILLLGSPLVGKALTCSDQSCSIESVPYTAISVGLSQFNTSSWIIFNLIDEPSNRVEYEKFCRLLGRPHMEFAPAPTAFGVIVPQSCDVFRIREELKISMLELQLEGGSWPLK